MSSPIHYVTSSNVYLNAIEWGGWAWSDPGPGTQITYYFDPAGVSLDSVFGAGTGNSVAWSAGEMAAYRAAIQTWANVANIQPVEVSSYGAANLVEHVAGAGVGALGIHETPDSAYSSDGTAWGVYSYTGDGWTPSGLLSGGYGFATLVHEIGHGLGMAHPHDNGGGSGVFPGVTPGAAFGDYGDNNLNQGIFTIMSYNDGWDVTGQSASRDYGWQATPMAFDIAAIQYLYGANTTYHSTSDAYYLPGSNGPGTQWTCIWDTAGLDGIYYTGAGNAVINLQAATLDDTPTGGGVPSYVQGVIGGFTIANGVFIETASGGSGNDTINGNESYNYLYGNGGSDTIHGNGGDDVVVGDAGNDFLYGDAGNDVLSELAAGAASGDDSLYGGNGIDIMYSGDGNDYVDGGNDTANNYANLGSGADTYFGAYGTDVVEGLAGNDIISGWGGDDSLYGGTENDTIYGDFQNSTSLGTPGVSQGIDLLSGGAGNDNLYGGGGNDLLVGDDGADTLYGQQGIDVLYGGAGVDIINGGPDTDGLYGGAGNDIFQVGGDGFGYDYIWDYNAGDQLVFQAGNFASVAAVRAASSFASGNTTITVPNSSGAVVVLVAYNINLIPDANIAVNGSF